MFDDFKYNSIYLYNLSLNKVDFYQNYEMNIWKCLDECDSLNNTF